MRTKAALKRLRAIARLRAIIRAFGEGLGCRSNLTHLHAELAAAERQLTTAEDLLALRLERFSGLQQEQADARIRLYLRQSRIRQLLAGLPDADSVLKRAGLAGATAQTESRLLRQTELTLALLRRLERAASQPIPGLTLDFATLAADLIADHHQFRAATADVVEARPVVVGTRGRATQAIATADHVVSCVARTLEGLSRLADQPVLAERIQAAARR